MITMEDYEKVVRSNAVVCGAIRAGYSLMQIIVVMNEVQNELSRRIFELEGICPRKLTMPDGAVMVYHAPVERIPEITIVGKTKENSPDLKSPV